MPSTITKKRKAMMIFSWMIIKLLISALIFSFGSTNTRCAQAFVHPHHHRFAITCYVSTMRQITTRYTTHLSSTPNEIEEGDDFFTQASQQASRQRFQQLKDGVSPLAVSLSTTSLTSSSDATDSGSSSAKDKKNDTKETAEQSKPISQEIKIPNEPQIKIPNDPPSINVVKEAQKAIQKEIEEDKKQVVDPILQSIKNARPDSSADVSETNESETNSKTQEELEDELRSIKLGAKLAEDAERFWGSTSKDDEVTAKKEDETKDQAPDEVIQEEPTAKEVEKIRTEEDSIAETTEEKQSEPIFSIDTDEIVAQTLNMEEEGDIADTANILGEEQKKADEDGEVKVPIDSVKKEDQNEDEIAPSADVEDTTTEKVPISSVEEDTTAEVTSPTSSSDEQIPMPSSSGEESIPRLSSDGKALYEPKQSEPGEVNQDNVDMGLLVLTQGLYALKSIVDKKE